MSDPDRQTGRSTRMLQEAITWQRSNPARDVVVICAHAPLAHYLCDLARQLGGDLRRMQFATPDQASSRLRGRRDGVFFDHTCSLLEQTWREQWGRSQLGEKAKPKAKP